MTVDFAETSFEEQAFVPKNAAYGLFYAALLIVVLIATLWPYFANKVKSYVNPGEEFTSARNTQPWWSITCSFFSTSLGCWVLTAPPEIAQEYSLWGIVGYALATSVPWVCVAFFGPRMRRLTDGKGFSNIDFVKARLGATCHVVYSVASFASVFLAYVVECISLTDIILAVSPGVRSYVLTCSIAVAVYFYTCVSGLQATLLTDRFQLMAIFVLLILASVGVFHYAVKEIEQVDPTQVAPGTPSALSRRMEWTGSGFVSLLVLNISCFYPTFMDPASWSRMYAARSERDASLGLLVAAALLCIPMVIFGFMGLVSGAAMDAGLVSDPSIFSTLTLLHPWWNGVMLVLATLLSTSTVDTLSSSLTSFIVANFAAFKLEINVNLARLATLVLTAIGIVVVIKNPPTVMTLFMCCNLITTCTTCGLLLSLWDFVTPVGVLSGIAGGALTVLSIGWGYYNSFRGGFDWWLLPEGTANASALWTFLGVGSISIILTLGVSQFQFYLWPESREQQREKLRSTKGSDLAKDLSTLSCRSLRTRSETEALVLKGEAEVSSSIVNQQLVEASV